MLRKSAQVPRRREHDRLKCDAIPLRSAKLAHGHCLVLEAGAERKQSATYQDDPNPNRQGPPLLMHDNFNVQGPHGRAMPWSLAEAESSQDESGFLLPRVLPQKWRRIHVRRCHGRRANADATCGLGPRRDTRPMAPNHVLCACWRYGPLCDYATSSGSSLSPGRKGRSFDKSSGPNGNPRKWMRALSLAAFEMQT